MNPAPPPRLTLLHGFSLEPGGGVPPPDLPRAVQRLLARLGLSRCPDRTAIAGQLWPDVPEDHAHGSLRSALWRLRRVAPGTVEVSGGTLCLAPAVRVDVRELETWAARVLDPQGGDAGLAVPGEALRGPLLPGWSEEWVLLERERLRQLRMHALEALADRLAVAGRFAEAVEAAYAAVGEEPLRESAHRAVVRVHLAEGNLAEARRAYASFRDLLAGALGVAPTPSMTALVRRPAGPAVVDVPVARPARWAIAGRLGTKQ
ncbi:DNA-binding transcriptional activator of the SARP family [Geodermatophilus telluris]|uniref:DNA-binding transcriptional activator of the SARP family n=1 Tax=Geodermatophilus telluris TaxID=1190417 RepID=A0A1G6V3U2_9ACTN|nr:BTAD domain-containing putative transcriptional regulator [Geodermatophilus telluris]SDD48319.1 DNA-binding transcriptional activator of the SARP family [Geodermatophilus telluris]